MRTTFLCILSTSLMFWIIFVVMVIKVKRVERLNNMYDYRNESYTVTLPTNGVLSRSRLADKYYKVYSIKLGDDPSLRAVSAVLQNYISTWKSTKPPKSVLDKHFNNPTSSFLRLQKDCQYPLMDKSFYGFIEDYLHRYSFRPFEKLGGNWSSKFWNHRYSKYSFRPTYMISDSDEYRLMLSDFDENTRGDVLSKPGIRGMFWYPPGGYREWHTNKHNVTGWRAYIISTRKSPRAPRNADRPGSYLGVMRGSKFITCPDRDFEIKLFHIRSAEDELNWHCVMSMTNDRLSIGINPSETLANYLIGKADRIFK